jgi:hypothetical protein
VGFHPCALRLEMGCFCWRCDVDAGDIVGCVLLGGIGSRSVTFSREECAFLVEITSVDGWLVPSSFVDGWIVRVSLGAVDDWIVRTGVVANDGHGADADHNDDGCFAL